MVDERITVSSQVQSLHFLPFARVPFVVATAESDEKKTEIKSEKLSFLDGQELKQFYESVISDETQQKAKDVQSQSVATKNKHKLKLLEKHASLPSSKCTRKFRNEKIVLQFAQDGKLNDIREFIAEGGNINITDDFGWSPIMCAVCAGHKDVVKFLLQNGANCELKNDQGLTVVELARKMKLSKEIQVLLNSPVECEKTEQKCDMKTEKEIKYCASCQANYSESSYRHASSILHLFNTGKKKTEKTFYHIPEHNKGFQIMLKEGWDKNKGLGPTGEGQKYPVKTILKKDRSCIGSAKGKERITHFGPYDKSAVKGHSTPSLNVKTVREKTLKKWKQKKIQRRNRQKEIEFRRQFHPDS